MKVSCVSCRFGGLVPNCEICEAENQIEEGTCTNCGSTLNPLANYCLIGLPGPHAGSRFSITPVGLQVGRIPEQNELVIADSEISRQHAKLIIANGGVKLTDTSANGTFVNDQRVTEANLKPGDR